MIKTIVKWLLIGGAIVLLAAWLWAGGWAAIRSSVAALPSPVDIFFGTSTAQYKITLPGALDAPRGPDISGLVAEGNAHIEKEDPQSQLEALQSRYEELRAQAQDPRNQGLPSPYRGEVTLSVSGARSPSPDSEYVVLTAHGDTPVDVSGWVIESLYSGVRAVVPMAAQPLVQGTVNRVSPVLLSAGEHAIVTTGASPVGVSFEETRCTGYLSEPQEFEPSLQNACPAPSTLLPETPQNLRTYGGACFDYLATVPQCQSVIQPPASLPANCRVLLANELSYNGCASRLGNAGLGTWHLYLGFGVALWNDSRDVIRLLDAEGRTVDAVTY